MTRAFPALGIVPLALFGTYAAVAAQRGRAADALWMCHVANLLLAIGMFACSPRIVGIALLWIAIGIPLWAMDAWLNRTLAPVSLASHLGGLAVGIYAASRLRLSSNPWLGALALFIALQQVCRWWTPPALNVNLAHAAYTGWEGVFGSYAMYWLATTLAAGACLWALGRLLVIRSERGGHDDKR
ncbi:MAG TPA: hypothetical protein VFA72_14475 [Burkholderiales bacterium]|nr:hypothetical protein [Burkholderiales bacterium]